jgi:hypothetical protein
MKRHDYQLSVEVLLEDAARIHSNGKGCDRITPMTTIETYNTGAQKYYFIKGNITANYGANADS